MSSEQFKRSPYWPVISHPVLRLLIPAFALSYLGDGLALVAVVLLAQQLTPSASLVGLAVAASTLPGAIGAALLGRWLRGRPGALLSAWDALLRTVVFAAIAVSALSGVLGIASYIVLLAVSSLLHAWGSAGRYTLFAELLPEQNRLAGNALLSTLSGIGIVAGPPLGGLLISVSTPALVIGVDAATFALLSASYLVALRRTGPVRPAPVASRSRTPNTEVHAGALRFLLGNRRLAALLALSVLYFAAFGPVYVALPAKLADAGASSTILGLYYTAFGVGTLVGAAATGYLAKVNLWTTLSGIVLGFGAAMLPLALGAPTALALPAFAVAGAIWAPYTATSMALLQSGTDPAQRTSVLTANNAVLITAVPVGTALGGPAVDHIGAQQTLAISAFTILALGLLVTVVRLRQAQTAWRSTTSSSPRFFG